MYQCGKKFNTLIVRRRMSAYVQSAKADDRVANPCVYTFAVCLGNHTQLALRDSDDRSTRGSSLTLLEWSFLSS